jgi:hypothetical protein
MLVLLMPVSVACGHVSKKNDDVKRDSLGTPIGYEAQDGACQGASGSTAIGSQGIETWNGQAFAQETVDFSKFDARSVDDAGLTSRHISATGFGLHMRTTTNCTVDEDGNMSCDEGKDETLTEGRPLKVCRPTGGYDRDSLEGIALATMANVERMRDSYSTLPEAKSLDETVLFVMPNIENVVNASQPSTKRSKSVIYSDTDNAAFAAGDDHLYFIVYPRSQELAAKPGYGDVRLWEIPWVMDHEFSHQIFYTFYSRYREDVDRSDELKGLPGLSEIVQRQRPDWQGQIGRDLDIGIELDGPGLALDGDRRTVGVRDALSAVNEGFADTFATYTMGGPSALFCLGQTRDVTADHFADGQAKVLSQTVRDRFFDVNEEDSSSDPCAVSFQDSHAVGAIISHGIHRILTATADAADAKVPSPALQSRALAWLSAFDQERRGAASPSAEDLWVLAIRAALDVARDGGASVPQAVCDATRSVFPVHASDALDGIECQ